MKRLLPLFLSLFSSLLFINCGGDDKEENISKLETTKALLPGRWKQLNSKLETYDSQGKLTETRAIDLEGLVVEEEYTATSATIYINQEFYSYADYILQEKDGKVYMVLNPNNQYKFESEVVVLTKSNLTTRTDAKGTPPGIRKVQVTEYIRK